MKKTPIAFSKGLMGVIGCLYVGGLGLMGWGLLPRIAPALAPSGLKFEGKSMSTADANLAIDEIAKMMKGGKAGDPSSVNMDIELKTPLARRFRDYIIKVRTIEEAYQTEMGHLSLDAMFESDRLAKAAGREKSLHEIDAMEQAMRQHTQAINQSMQELGTMMGELSAKFDPALMKANLAGNDTLLEKQLKVCESYRELIVYLDKSKLAAGAGLSKTQLAVVGKLSDKASEAEKDEAAFEKSEGSRRQKSMDENMQILSGH